MFRLFGAAGNACHSTFGCNANVRPWISFRALASGTTSTTRRKWSNEEEESLIGLRNSGMTNDQISIELGRSYTSVRACVGRLRRTGVISGKRLAAASFTPEEDSRLLTATQGSRDWDHITKLFPDRPTGSLRARFILLSRNECREVPDRRGRFSEEEDARLLYNYHRGTLSIHQIAALLSRGYHSVYSRFRALGNVHVDDKSPLIKAAATEYEELKRSGNLPEDFHGLGGPRRRWTPQEISQCLDMAAAGADKGEIASKLHRTRFAVGRMLQRGQTSAYPRRLRRWTEEERSRLLALRASGVTFVEIAQELSRSLQSVESQYSVVNRRPKVQAAGIKPDKIRSEPEVET